jgi:chromosome segregation ATPase
MAPPENFIQQFEDSMARLSDLRKGIQANVQMKEQFSNNVKNSLSQINSRLKELYEQINSLKKTVDELQSQVTNHNAFIGDKDKQLSELQEQMKQLKEERDTALAQLNEEKQQLMNQINEKQQQIDQLEAQLRDVTTLKDSLTAERDALRSELQGKGDLAQQHAQQIQTLTEEAQQREQDLNNKINECDAKIQGFEQQLAEKDGEILRVNEEHKSTQGAAQNASQELQNQIEVLTQQNQQYIERIVQATSALNEAADDLDSIYKGVPNAQTQDEVKELLDQIEQSLQNIGSAIQGQRAAAPPIAVESSQGQEPLKPLSERIPSDTIIVIKDMATNKPKPVEFGAIMKMLSDKSRIKGASESYNKALNAIKNFAKESTDVAFILKANNIVFKNDKIMGGKKTKKNKKQRGGFTYKITSKRRSISSTPKSSRRYSRRTSK